MANSDSFTDLEEYRVSYPLAVHESVRGKVAHPNLLVDENTLILGIFEETPARPIWRPETGSTRSESSAPADAVLRASNILGLESTQALPVPLGSHSMYGMQDFEFSEANLRLHYRSFVRRHLFRISHDAAIAGLETEDLFEREAAYCPPVSLHPMFSLSVLIVWSAARGSYGSISTEPCIPQKLSERSRIRALHEFDQELSEPSK